MSARPLLTEIDEHSTDTLQKLGLEILELGPIERSIKEASIQSEYVPLEELDDTQAPETTEECTTVLLENTKDFNQDAMQELKVTADIRDSVSTLHQEPSQPSKRPPMHFTKQTVVLILVAFIILVGVITTILLVVVYKPDQPSSAAQSSTATVILATPATNRTPSPTSTATKLSSNLVLFSPNRNSRLMYLGDTCHLMLYSEGFGERWSNSPNSFYNCDLHLRMDGNLVMYFGNVVVWQALGAPVNGSVAGSSLAVVDDGKVVLRNGVGEVYWSRP